MPMEEPLVTFNQFSGLYKDPRFIDTEKADKFLPLYKSEKLAGIVADLMSDGHLQGHPKWRFDYTSNSTEELLRFERTVSDLFELRGKIRKCSTNKYGTMNIGFNCKPLARILFLCGVPAGSKTEQSYPVPNWILNNKTCFREFLRRYLSCEGYVDKDGSIDFCIYKNNLLESNGVDFMNQIRNGLLEFFEIKATNPFFVKKQVKRKNKEDSKGIRLKIKNKDSLLKFYMQVGLGNKMKMEKLKITLFNK
jgi:hypothetical protein